MIETAKLIDAIRPTIDATRDKSAGTYTLSGRCINCGRHFDVKHSKGFVAGDADCPNCGCKRVRSAPAL